MYIQILKSICMKNKAFKIIIGIIIWLILLLIWNFSANKIFYYFLSDKHILVFNIIHILGMFVILIPISIIVTFRIFRKFDNR